MRIRHCGKIGDVIYCMAAMKRLADHAGAVDVLLNNYHLTAGAIDALLPLLRSQPYIRSANVDDDRPCDVDFRTWILDYDHQENAIWSAMQFVRYELGVEINTSNETFPWLSIDAPESGYKLINWTGRYRNDEPVAWAPIIEQHSPVHFVGTPEEHQHFQQEVGVPLTYLPTRDLFDLACLIRGASLFMGGLSSPLAIAHGLGKQVIVEASLGYPNCIIIGRGTYLGVDENTISRFGRPKPNDDR
jgi:hypothetical protein